MSSVFNFILVKQIIALAQNFLNDDVVSSMKLPNSIEKLEIARKSLKLITDFMTIFS